MGKPDNVREYGDGVLYEYGLFYSLFINVQFDSNGKVQKIVACAPSLGDESAGRSGKAPRRNSPRRSRVSCVGIPGSARHNWRRHTHRRFGFAAKEKDR